MAGIPDQRLQDLSANGLVRFRARKDSRESYLLGTNDPKERRERQEIVKLLQTLFQEIEKINGLVRSKLLREIDELWHMAEENGWGYDPPNWPHPFNHCFRKAMRTITKFDQDTKHNKRMIKDESD